MAAENFERALALVLRHEGGFSRHPQDPGGATMRGCTQRVYDAWRASLRLPPRSVRLIEDAELQAIYKRQYWDAIRGDDLPCGIDYAAFDFAVNSGPGRAVRVLQNVLDVSIDGHIGQVTLRAAQTADAAEVIDLLCDARTSWLRRLRIWSVFGRGWDARVNGRRVRGRLVERGVRQHAVAMADEAFGLVA